jgi:nitrate/nitrite transporter NarK
MSHDSSPRSKRVFARHFGEMVLVMFLGMGVLSGLAVLVFELAGGSLSDQSGAFRVMLMAFSMTAPMVMWMSYRSHSRARNAEMAASMLMPSFLAAILAWAGVLGAAGALTMQHVVMIPAMLAVMLWRYDEYSRRHGQIGLLHARRPSASSSVTRQ